MYEVRYSENVRQLLKKMDQTTRLLVLKWIDKNLYQTEDPRLHGKRLKGNPKEYWRYRIGDFRLLVKIFDDQLIIYTIEIGHRKDVYDW